MPMCHLPGINSVIKLQDLVHSRKEPLGGSGLAEVDEQSKRDSQLSTKTDDLLPSIVSPDERRCIARIITDTDATLLVFQV